MKIEEIEISPFEIIDKCIRQQKARDGEIEGGWRLDLVIKNTDRKTRSKIKVSLRYYDKDQKFIGLDSEKLWHEEYIKHDEIKDLSFYIEPPKETEKAELRINSKNSVPAWVHDPPVWFIFVFCGIILAVGILIHQLLQ